MGNTRFLFILNDINVSHEKLIAYTYAYKLWIYNSVLVLDILSEIPIKRECQSSTSSQQLGNNLKSYDKGKQIDMAILDFSKAFDTVPHKKLLHKLDQYGITGPAHRWLTNLLKKRKMRVTLEAESSQQVTIDSGAPQGTLLGPILFLCHINDLPDAVKSSVRLFADDCLLYREINSQNDHNKLQKDLENLEEWAENWGMRFNATKCYFMSIKKKTHTFYQLGGHILEQVDSNPYPGLQISEDLKWNTHILNITKKANSTIGFLRRNLQHCPKECRKNAYISLVRSVLEYGATI